MKLKYLCLLLPLLLVACKPSAKITGQVEGKFCYITAPKSGLLTYVITKHRVASGGHLFCLSRGSEQNHYRRILQRIQYIKTRLNNSHWNDFDSAFLKPYERSVISLNEQQLLLWMEKQHLKTLNVNAKKNSAIYNVLYHEGMYVDKGAPVLSTLPTGGVFIVFYVKKHIQKKLHLDSGVTFVIDNKYIPAVVTYISFKPVQSSYSLQDKTAEYFQIQAQAVHGNKALIPGETVDIILGL